MMQLRSSCLDFMNMMSDCVLRGARRGGGGAGAWVGVGVGGKEERDSAISTVMCAAVKTLAHLA